MIRITHNDRAANVTFAPIARALLYVAVALLALALTACGSVESTVRPDEITVTNYRSRMQSVSWTATCRGERYVCATQLDSPWSTSATCTER